MATPTPFYAWRALTSISYLGKLAYTKGDIVPDANVALYGYDAKGLVERVQVTDTLPSPDGVDLVTQAELSDSVAGLVSGAVAPAVDSKVDGLRGAPGGLAEIGTDGKVSTPLPDLSSKYVSASKVNAANGVAATGADGKVSTPLPDLSGTYATTAVKRALRPGPGKSVALGDSITWWDGDGNPLRQRDTWFQQLCARTGQRIRYGGVFATYGYTLSQIRDTHLPTVLAMNPAPAACFVFGGTNTEATGVAAGFPVLIDICAKLEAKGIAPVLVTLLPRSDANNANHQNWNNALRTLAARRGYLLYDPAPALLDASGAQNLALYADTNPSVHPIRPAGHTAMAKRGVTDELASAFPKLRVTSKEKSSANNLLPYDTGLFLADASGDGLADNWQAAGTNVTYALVPPVAGDDLVGNWQKITRTPGGTTSTVMQRSAATGFAAGDTVALAGRFRATVEGTGSTYTVQAQWTGAPNAPHSLEPLYTWEHNDDGTFYGEAVVPTGTTSINVQVALSIPTSGAPTIQVGELTLINLSAGAAMLPA